MEQQPLFFEDVLAALKYTVQCIGKPKDVGSRIFPHKEDPEAAGRMLSDCLNENRNNRLDPEQLILLLRMAKEKGCHSGIEYICQAAGYSRPEPINEEDEKAELQREFIASVGKLGALASQLGINVATGKR